MKTLAKLVLLVIFSLTFQLAQTNCAQAYVTCGGAFQPPCYSSFGGISYSTWGWDSDSPFGMECNLVSSSFGAVYEVKIFPMPTEMTKAEATIKLADYTDDFAPGDFGGYDTPFFAHYAKFMILTYKEISEDCFNDGLAILTESEDHLGGVEHDCPCEGLNDEDNDVQYYAWIVTLAGDEEDITHYYCVKRIETDVIRWLLEKEAVDAAYAAAKDTGEAQVLVDRGVKIELVPDGDKVSMRISGINNYEETERTGEAIGTIEDVSDVIAPEGGDEEEHHHWHHHHKWFKKLHHQWNFECPIEF